MLKHQAVAILTLGSGWELPLKRILAYPSLTSAISCLFSFSLLVSLLPTHSLGEDVVNSHVPISQPLAILAIVSSMLFRVFIFRSGMGFNPRKNTNSYCLQSKWFLIFSWLQQLLIAYKIKQTPGNQVDWLLVSSSAKWWHEPFNCVLVIEPRGLWAEGMRLPKLLSSAGPQFPSFIKWEMLNQILLIAPKLNGLETWPLTKCERERSSY